MNEPLEYWRSEVRRDLGSAMREINDMKYSLQPPLTVFWLDAFLSFIKKNGISEDKINRKDNFLFFLDLFLSDAAAADFRLDILFNANKTQITTSRFFVQTTNMHERRSK
eukprot:m.49564 g.49564  ORF g.49564 m.49564 type:complete len:110 (+) comp34012_c0_seq1:1816-2145(+)